MNINNTNDLLSILKQYKISKQQIYGILELGVFGSFARGEANDSSDVDIVIKTEQPDLFKLVHIKKELEEQLNLPVDIVRLRKKMNPYLKKRIEKEALYV